MPPKKKKGQSLPQSGDEGDRPVTDKTPLLKEEPAEGRDADPGRALASYGAGNSGSNRSSPAGKTAKRPPARVVSLDETNIEASAASSIYLSAGSPARSASPRRSSSPTRESQSVDPIVVQPSTRTSRAFDCIKRHRHAIYVFSAMAVLALIATVIPVVYNVVIPRYIEASASGSIIKFQETRIKQVRNSSLDLHVKAEVVLKSIAPTDVLLEATEYGVYILTEGDEVVSHGMLHAMDGGRRDSGPGILMGILMFPAINLVKGQSSVQLDFDTVMENVNVTYILAMSEQLREGGKPPKQVMESRGRPWVKVGPFAWRVNIRNRVPVEPGDVFDDFKKYNFTVVSKELDGMPPRHVMLNTSFINPFPFALAPQGFSIETGFYHDGGSIGTAYTGQDLQIQMGDNYNVVFHWSSDLVQFARLMKLIARIADDDAYNASIIIKDLKPVYHDDKRERIEWMEKLLTRTVFNVTLNAAILDKILNGDDSFVTTSLSKWM